MNRGICLVILACLAAGPVFGRSYEITPRKISSKAEPGGRHVIGEIRYHFPAGSAWARLDYVATFDMHRSSGRRGDGSGRKGQRNDRVEGSVEMIRGRSAPAWRQRMVAELGLHASLRDRGRPKKRAAAGARES